MTCIWLLRLFYIILSFYQIQSLESSLHCWRCEKTIQSSEQIGVFLDDCQADFDFTQHTRENCDGKCWKSVDLTDSSKSRNLTLSFFNYMSLYSKLKSSRRCFTATELVRAAEMGVNTSDGCQQVKRDNKKIKEICFCSDQDMCNNGLKLIINLYILCTVFSLLYI